MSTGNTGLAEDEGKFTGNIATYGTVFAFYMVVWYRTRLKYKES